VARPKGSFDPRGLLAALERKHVAYVLIGGLARVIRGADEVTAGVDVCPAVRAENRRRLEGVLDDLGLREALPGRTLDEAIRAHPVIALPTTSGALKIIPEPAGTRGGFPDLRRAATREHIGHGLRPSVASVADLARMTAARGREADAERLRELRLIMEIEANPSRSLGVEPLE
jgi:hypothetical protein